MILLLPFVANAQKEDISKYLVGAVPVVNGQVTFDKTYETPGKTKDELFSLLKGYTQSQILNGPNHLEQCAITESDSINGVLAASVEEYLYFKKKAWVSHYVRFYYQLIYRIQDGQFSIQLRRINYLYDDERSSDEEYRAEDWIVDSEALNSDKTKLTRIAGKFRKFTIDRKDEIFRGAALAAGAVLPKKIIYVDE